MLLDAILYILGRKAQLNPSGFPPKKLCSGSACLDPCSSKEPTTKVKHEQISSWLQEQRKTVWFGSKPREALAMGNPGSVVKLASAHLLPCHRSQSWCWEVRTKGVPRFRPISICKKFPASLWKYVKAELKWESEMKARTFPDGNKRTSWIVDIAESKAVVLAALPAEHTQTKAKKTRVWKQLLWRDQIWRSCLPWGCRFCALRAVSFDTKCTGILHLYI